jgi:hypothetical protein
VGLHLLTGEAVPAAPIAVEAALGLATIATLLAFVVCWGLKAAWDATIGYGLRWIANEIRGVDISFGWFGSVHPFEFVAKVFEAVDNHISHALAVAALNTQHAFVFCFHQFKAIGEWMARETWHLAKDTYAFALRFEKHYLPHVLHDIGEVFKHRVSHAVADAEAFTLKTQRKIDRRIHAVEVKLLHGIHVVQHSIAAELPRIGNLEHDFKGVRARLKRLEKLLTPAAFVALVAAALGTLGLNAIRCPSLRNMYKKRGCGMWNDLEGLLAAATLLVGTLSLVELAREEQKVVGEAAKIVSRYWEL